MAEYILPSVMMRVHFPGLECSSGIHTTYHGKKPFAVGSNHFRAGTGFHAGCPHVTGAGFFHARTCRWRQVSGIIYSHTDAAESFHGEDQSTVRTFAHLPPVARHTDFEHIIPVAVFSVTFAFHTRLNDWAE